MSKATFGIVSAKDYFEKILKPNYETFLSAPLDVKNAITACIIVWHQKDWIWSLEKEKLNLKYGISVIDDKEFHKKIFEKCGDLKIVQEIATHSKHASSDNYNQIEISQQEDGFAAGLLLLTVSYLTIKINGQRFFLINILRNCVDYWKGLIEDLEK